MKASTGHILRCLGFVFILVGAWLMSQGLAKGQTLIYPQPVSTVSNVVADAKPEPKTYVIAKGAGTTGGNFDDLATLSFGPPPTTTRPTLRLPLISPMLKSKEELEMERTQAEVRRLEEALKTAKAAADIAWRAYVRAPASPVEFENADQGDEG